MTPSLLCQQEQISRLDYINITPKKITCLGITDLEEVVKRFPSASIQQIKTLNDVASFDKQDLWLLHFEQALPENYPHYFAIISQKLNPEGLLFFSTFGPDTLLECEHRRQSSFNFIDMHDLGDSLLSAHFVDPVMDMQKDFITLKAPFDHANWFHQPIIKHKLQPFEHALTLECIYGLAWAAPQTSQAPLKGGRAQISLEALKEQLKKQGYQDEE